MPNREAMSKIALFGFLASLVFAEAAAGFETAMIYAALGELVTEFGDPAAAGWLVTIYLLVGAGSAAIIGKLGDRFGHRSVAMILLLLGALGSVLSLLVQDYWAVLTGRGLQGLTAALGPLCFGMLRNHVPPKILPITIGLMVTGAALGGISGLLLGGVIVDNAPWRSIFIASALLAALAATLLWFFAPQSEPNTDKPIGNVLTGVVFVPAIAGMLLIVSQASQWGIFSPLSLSIFVTSLGLFVFWFWRSLVEEAPLINVRLFASRNSLVGLIGMALLSIGAAQVTMVFHLMLLQPAWTVIGLGVSATLAGLVKIPSSILSLGGGPLSGWMSTQIGNRLTLMIGAGMTGAGWLAAAFFNDNIYQIVASLCVITLGSTIAYTSLATIVIQDAPEESTSEASGILAVVRTAFMAVGAQLVAEGLSLHTMTAPDGSGVEYPTHIAYSVLLITVAIITFLLALMGFWLRKKETLSTDAEAQTS